MFVAGVFIGEVFQCWLRMKEEMKNQAKIIRIARESACSLSLNVIALVAVLNSYFAQFDSHPVS